MNEYIYLLQILGYITNALDLSGSDNALVSYCLMCDPILITL